MHLISELYRGEDLVFVLDVQGQKPNNMKNAPPGQLVTRYISKVGNESLIFNPRIGLQIKAKKNQAIRCIVPHTIMHHIPNMINQVYEAMAAMDKLYIKQQGGLYMDAVAASKIGRRISIYSNTLAIVPCVTESSPGQDKGIAFIIDRTQIGALSQAEAMNVITILDKFDPTTFSLVASLLDRMDEMDIKLDRIECGIKDIMQALNQMNLDRAIEGKQQSVVPINQRPPIASSMMPAFKTVDEWRI